VDVKAGAQLIGRSAVRIGRTSHHESRRCSLALMLRPPTRAIVRSVTAVLEIRALSTHVEWRDVLTRLPL